MIRYKSSRQLSLDGFLLPWDDLAVAYYQTMDAKQGRPGKDARLVIAALIIKHKLTLSDE